MSRGLYQLSYRPEKAILYLEPAICQETNLSPYPSTKLFSFLLRLG